MLQCGDPSGTGTGGPGYRFPNEYPTDQYRLTDPALETPVVYPRGTLAMANAGPGTNGSQFFLVYEDSLLPPTYTRCPARGRSSAVARRRPSPAGRGQNVSPRRSGLTPGAPPVSGTPLTGRDGRTSLTKGRRRRVSAPERWSLA